MTTAIAILAHENLHRTAQLARFLGDAGMHVCIHVDKSVPPEQFGDFAASLSDCADILWPERYKCEWGRFSLVEATLGMSGEILAKWPDAGHVILLSGDSLPTRPPSEIDAFLQEHVETDFIESVAIGENNWIAGGLGIERFTLSFPFSWKKQRWLFDHWVEIQRALHVNRSIPDGLLPHIGSQWWCLTRSTLEAILTDPFRPQYDAYFKKCWIPDESYFHTLVRDHAKKIESRSLTYSRFDHQGKPITFYGDHAGLIDNIDAFFVRKVWSGASDLYERYLDLTPKAAIDHSSPAPELERLELADSRRKTGRSGLYMHGRAPSQWHNEHSPTAASYDVFTGFTAVFPKFDDWYEKHSEIRPHGRLFEKSGVSFMNASPIGVGGMSRSAGIRDLAPENFLCNLVWNTRDYGLKFHYEVRDAPKIRRFLLGDPHAHLHFVHHGWMLELLGRNIENPELLRTEAAAMIAGERAFVGELQRTTTKCSYNLWTLDDVLTNPLPALAGTLGDPNSSTPLALPEMIDAARLSEFARGLKNIGVDIDSTLLESPALNAQPESSVQAQQ